MSTPEEKRGKVGQSNLLVSISDKDKEIIRRAKRALKRLASGESWADWLLIGEALMAGRAAAMRQANTNDPTGAKYTRAMGAWLNKTGFDALDKGDRSRLLKCMENHEAIEVWLATLTDKERLRFNHPATVLRKWQSATKSQPKSARKPKGRLPDPTDLSHDRLAHIGANDQAIDWSKLTSDEMVALIVENVPATSRLFAITRGLVAELYTRRDVKNAGAEAMGPSAQASSPRERIRIQPQDPALSERPTRPAAAPPATVLDMPEIPDFLRRIPASTVH